LLHQLTVQDLPEVPHSAHEEIEENLDLPNVPTKAPVTSDAEVSTKRKGIFHFLLSSPKKPERRKKLAKF